MRVITLRCDICDAPKAYDEVIAFGLVVPRASGGLMAIDPSEAEHHVCLQCVESLIELTEKREIFV